MSKVFSFKTSLGGNYYIEFLTDKQFPAKARTFDIFMAVLIDGAPEGNMTLIESKSIDDATGKAKNFLKYQRGLNNILDEIERME